MALNWLVLDFETASSCDLKRAGAWRYSEDPTTEILCLCWETREGVRDAWVPGRDEAPLRALVADEQMTFIAHNAAFEKAIWRNIMVPVFGFSDIPNSRWHDTLAMCAMRGLPQQLERAALCLRLPAQKDMAGSKFTIGLSRPDKKTGMLLRSAEATERVVAYCHDDVKAQFRLHERLGFLPPGQPGRTGERGVWLLDQRINERGVRLDMPYVLACQTIVDRASGPLMTEFGGLTGGLSMTQVAKIGDWLAGQGVTLPNLQAETLDKVLGTCTEDTDDGDEIFCSELGARLPHHVRRALEIRQLIGSSSIKKLSSMRACVNADGRARGVLQYHGTGPGRWAGRLFQPQNFPRGTIKANVDHVVSMIMTSDPNMVEMTLGPAVETVVSGLRHSIVASPGRVLIAGDYAGIQARTVLAFSGQHDKAQLMADGLDIYCDMAQSIYKRPIDKKKDPAERQVGKNSVLGLGFQMGAKKFHWKYGEGQTLEFCQGVVQTYRREWAPLVPKTWYALEAAAVRAVHDKRPQEAMGVVYALEDQWLTVRLPSGRKLWYFDPIPTRKAMPWDPDDIRPSFSFKAMKLGQLRTIDAFGGQLTENVVMGIERDIMVYGMMALEQNGFPVILNVHDEIVTEPLMADADQDAAEQIMCEMPEWVSALRIPVAVEAWTGERYRK